jgi:hypothetical protein
VASLEPENIYGQAKLCSKNPTHDCRCGQISPRTKDCPKGSNRRSDYCRCRRRSCGGHEVKGRLGRPDAENRGETAVWKKQNEEGQDVAKEKDASLKHQSLTPSRGHNPQARLTVIYSRICFGCKRIVSPIAAIAKIAGQPHG